MGQCPVRMNTLKLLPRTGTFRMSKKAKDQHISETEVETMPFVYLGCGHVISHIDWDEPGNSSENSNEGSNRACPMCRQRSKYVQLKLGAEPAFLQVLEDEVSADKDI